ncbi:hypothetical protein ACU4GH_15485, partial [Bradyrhizobium betae]
SSGLSCDSAYTKILSSAASTASKILPGRTCRLPGNPPLRLPMKGGSMGFTKMEGTTVNIKDKVVTSALAAEHPQDSIVTNNAKCGWNAQSGISVPALPQGWRRDAAAAATRRRPEGPGRGRDQQRMGAGAYQGPDRRQGHRRGRVSNTGDPEMIANPDNLKFSEKLRTLFTGEDSTVRQYPVGLQRRHEEAVALAVGAGGRRIDRPACGR